MHALGVPVLFGRCLPVHGVPVLFGRCLPVQGDDSGVFAVGPPILPGRWRGSCEGSCTRGGGEQRRSGRSMPCIRCTCWQQFGCWSCWQQQCSAVPDLTCRLLPVRRSTAPRGARVLLRVCVHPAPPRDPRATARERHESAAKRSAGQRSAHLARPRTATLHSSLCLRQRHEINCRRTPRSRSCTNYTNHDGDAAAPGARGSSAAGALGLRVAFCSRASRDRTRAASSLTREWRLRVHQWWRVRGPAL